MYIFYVRLTSKVFNFNYRFFLPLRCFVEISLFGFKSDRSVGISGTHPNLEVRYWIRRYIAYRQIS